MEMANDQPGRDESWLEKEQHTVWFINKSCEQYFDFCLVAFGLKKKTKFLTNSCKQTVQLYFEGKECGRTTIPEKSPDGFFVYHIWVFSPTNVLFFMGWPLKVLYIPKLLLYVRFLLIYFFKRYIKRYLDWRGRRSFVVPFNLRSSGWAVLKMLLLIAVCLSLVFSNLK